MARKSKTVMLAKAMKSSEPTTSDDDDHILAWEGGSIEPLIYEARAIVDDLWPNTPTPEIVAGIWDHTPIMRAVLTALYRGIQIGEGDGILTA